MSDEQPAAQLIQDYLDKPLTVYNMRRIFILALQYHYSDPSHYGTLGSELQGIRYNPDDREQSLDVALYNNYDNTKSLPRPGVFMGFQPITFRKVVVGNLGEVSDDNATEYNTQVASTNLLVSHVAPSADTALLLGDSTAMFLAGFRPMLLKRACGNILGFDIGTMTDALKVKSAPNAHFKVDLLCPLSFNFIVTITNESHRLKKVSVDNQP